MTDLFTPKSVAVCLVMPIPEGLGKQQSNLCKELYSTNQEGYKNLKKSLNRARKKVQKFQELCCG